MLYSEHTECDKLTQLKKLLEESQFIKSKLENNKDLLEYLSLHTGWSISSIVQLEGLYDTLLTEEFFNKTLPHWTDAVFPGGQFGQLRNLFFLLGSFDLQMKRLQAGPFLSELVSHFDAVREGAMLPTARKMFMYAAHDTTISYVLNTLGIYDGLAPPFTSMVIIELYYLDAEYRVKISYRNDTNTQPQVLTIPGCHQLCPLQLLVDVSSGVVVGGG